MGTNPAVKELDHKICPRMNAVIRTSEMASGRKISFPAPASCSCRLPPVLEPSFPRYPLLVFLFFQPRLEVVVPAR